MQTALPQSGAESFLLHSAFQYDMLCTLSRLDGRLQCAGGEDVGQCLYVYGVPGTGKTATVSLVTPSASSLLPSELVS
jgi:Cdc6-like AAA superfamily ATPase